MKEISAQMHFITGVRKLNQGSITPLEGIKQRGLFWVPFWAGKKSQNIEGQDISAG